MNRFTPLFLIISTFLAMATIVAFGEGFFFIGAATFIASAGCFTFFWKYHSDPVMKPSQIVLPEQSQPFSEPITPSNVATHPIKTAIKIGFACGVAGWLLVTPAHWGIAASGTTMMFTAVDATGHPLSWGIRSSDKILSGPKIVTINHYCPVKNPGKEG